MEFLRGATDFYASTERALDEIDPGWRELPGVIVFGTHAFERVGEKLELIRRAREEKLPFYGECGGLQLAVIEYARNVRQMKGANSTEIDPQTIFPVVQALPHLRVGIRRVGDRYESFWHRYAVNPELYLQGDWIVTFDDDGYVAKIRLRDHPFFVGTQYHASYNSSVDKPHPVLVEFLEVCRSAAATHHR